MTLLALLSFLIWCWLLTMHGQFWRAGPVLPIAVPRRLRLSPSSSRPATRRHSSAVRYARCWRRIIRASFRVTLVDDRSEDGTGALARAIQDPRLNVIDGEPRPTGWAGKLWAVGQGIAASGTPDYFLLTDADIEHDSPHLASLLARGRTLRPRSGVGDGDAFL